MIVIEKIYNYINISLKCLFAGEDLSVLIVGGDTPHIGSVTIYSKYEGVKSIILKNHKDYIISEKFIEDIKDIVNGNIVVSCGIHVDNITREQLNIVNKISEEIFREFKEKFENIVLQKKNL